MVETLPEYMCMDKKVSMWKEEKEGWRFQIEDGFVSDY